jgi:hypothetical protein
MGDGVLLEFPSVVAAVECAIEIQKMMAERNATVPEANRILYRVGVNLGDILVDGEDILGDGVNVAARLEGNCEPGGICVSSSAYEQVRGRIEAEFVDLGEQTLKNIARPVRAYALTPAAIAASGAASTAAKPSKTRRVSARLSAFAAAVVVALLAAGTYAWHSGLAPHVLGVSVADDKLANAPRLSIIVLPFENLSGDKDQDYFADGITDDLTTDLSHLHDSFVISRGTAFTYKGKPVDAKQIGKDPAYARFCNRFRAVIRAADGGSDPMGQTRLHIFECERLCLIAPCAERCAEPMHGIRQTKLAVQGRFGVVLDSFSRLRYRPACLTLAKLTPADPCDLAEAIAFALRYRGRRRVHQADEYMARIAAERIVSHLEAARFVVMRRPPIGGSAPARA